MSAEKRDCCFLDTSILISHFFGKFKNKMEKFLTIKGKYGIPCFISSSVENECEERIGRVLDFIGVSMTLLRMRLSGEKTRTQHEIILTEQDILLIELLIQGLFRELSSRTKSEIGEIPEIEQTLLRALEYSVVDFFEQKFKENASLSMIELEVFLANCLNDFLDIKEAFRIQKRNLTQKKDITPEPKLVEEIQKIGVPKKDAEHIASAIQYIFPNKLSGVFLSFDYKHIVNFQEQIYEQFKFQVCDPIYAYWHLKYEETFRELIES